MATAKKLPSGNWRIQIYIGTSPDGKKHKKSITASTRWECEKLAEEYLQGKHRCDLTVGECIDRYIDLKEPVLSPSSVYVYRKIRKTRLQSLMDIPAEEVGSRAVQRAVSIDAARVSRTSIIQAVSIMKAALKLQGVALEISVTYPPKKSIIKTLPSPNSVIEAVAGTSVELPVLLALCLGLRCSEVRGLTKSDLQDGILYVHRRRLYVGGEDIVQEINKTDTSCRSLICPQFLAEKISACETEFLCPLSYPQLQHRFCDLMQAAHLKITFHGLRHINATTMRRLGVPDKYAMERGGWSSPSVMKSVYQNVFSDERAASDATVNTFFEKIYAESSLKSSHKSKK